MFNDFKIILKENYDIDDIKLNTNFKKDLGLSSFDFVNLVCIIEKEYNVVIEEKDYRNMNTIQELVEYLEKKRLDKLS